MCDTKLRTCPGGSMLTSLAVLVCLSSVSAAPAAQEPDRRLLEWAASGQAEAIRDLLSETEQVVVDLPDDAGWTALMHAVQGGHETVVRLLMDAGASVHLQNDAQETALHLAAQYGRTEAARLLLEADADFAARDADGRTPLFRAIGGGHAEIIEMLHVAALSANRVSPGHALAPEGDTTSPMVIEWASAPYTDEALALGIEGTVVLIVLVRQDGSVGAANVSESLEQSLDRSALRTVRTWKFDPATRAGEPVAVVVEINVDFELPEERSGEER